MNEPDEKERESNEIKDINEIKDEIIINKSNIKSNKIKETDKKIIPAYSPGSSCLSISHGNGSSQKNGLQENSLQIPFSWS